MFKMCKINNEGSVTVETAGVMGIVITMILLIMYVTFFLHDYTVISAQAKYNLMKSNEDYKPITFMGRVYDREQRKKIGKEISTMKLKYSIPILGTNSWKISVSENVTSIDNLRKIKVLEDGINQFTKN
ncbi:MAG: pilus assembly protein [Lachnospiraceae bacterium]|nr:pilus assembly protein [Lachnospiraceae bacterium]MBQ4069426.1 pilus assembly protein [Lachnospiraceae bacterium]